MGQSVVTATGRSPSGGSLRAAASRALRQYWAWGQVRRVQAQGIRSSFTRHGLWLRALESSPAHTVSLEEDAPYELHLVCHFADYLSAVWSLKSYLRRVGGDAHLYVHLQGHHTRTMVARLTEHFPQAKILTQAAADQIVVPELNRRGLARLARLRAASAVMLKLVDVALIGRLPRLLLLDGDVLFFRRPEELHTALLGSAPLALFQKDAFTCYMIEPLRAQSDLGIPLVERLNSGLVAIDRAVVDLDLCERLLATPPFRSAIESPNPSGWVEQTLYAVTASASGLARWLPDQYALSMEAEPGPGDIVSRHYSGPSRRFMSAEGMPWLLREGLVAGRSGNGR